jgi:ATP-dependent RNA helicase RhlE
MNFKLFNLHPHVESGIEALAYTVPTPIQRQAIPLILQKRDVIGQAQTGTGKTAAFVLPILQRLMAGPRNRIRALILAPTRELAEQTHDTIGRLGFATKVKSLSIYGGVKQKLQISKLRRGAEVVVACPGRLIDLMDKGLLDLSGVEMLVIDEADRMFDMGFLPDVRTILSRLPSKKQTLLFSATMPDAIRNFAESILQDPVTIKIGEAVPVSTVSHAIYPVDPHLKTPLLMNILSSSDMGSVLVFTRTKSRASRLAKQMKKSGFPATSLQGDLSHFQRQEALQGFRNGKYQFLVATDIASRGIDVSGISHVINYDMPDTVEAYTHRVGRTGRAAMTGDALTFVTRPDRAFVWTIENVLGEKLERRIVENFNYTIPTNTPEQSPLSSRTPTRPYSGGRKRRRDISEFPFLKGSPQVKSDQPHSAR